MKALIIEDDPVIADTVTICFQLRWPEAEVMVTDSGEKGLTLAISEDPDVVILDVGLPGINGYETLRRLRDISDVPIIMLTAQDGEVAKVKGLEWGADDYITKPFSHIELLARVRAVLRRGPAQDALKGTFFNADAGLEIDMDARKVTRHGKAINLAPLEYSLLFQLVTNEGRVIPHDTLLTKVWGREYTQEIDYLKVYVRRLRTKLGDDPQNPQLIHTERGIGYMFQVRIGNQKELTAPN